MDGSHYARAFAPDETQPTPAADPAHEPGRGPLPEREWGLSAGQVVMAVVIIVALCQALGAIYAQ